MKVITSVGLVGALACALVAGVVLKGAGNLAPEAEDPQSIRDANWEYVQVDAPESAAQVQAQEEEAAPKVVAAQDGQRYGAGKILITCSGALAEDDVRRRLEEHDVHAAGITLVSKLLENNGVLLEVSYEGAEDPAELSARLQDADFITAAEPDYVQTVCSVGSQDEEAQRAQEDVSAKAQELFGPAAQRAANNHLSAVVDDTYAQSQWALSAVCASDAWDYARANGAVTVAVVDSGVDYDHPDLASNLILGSYAKNTYTGATGSFAVYDMIGHGTHVAGIISACTNNGKGVSGVSYNAKILPVKVTYGLDGSLFTSDVIEAIDYVVSLKTSSSSPDALKNIRVINLSLGGYTYSETYEAAVKRAYDAGILVVAAAGNNATDTKYYPAAYDGAFAVAALKESAESPYVEVDSSYSNYGTFVDIAAPGTNVYSTTIGNSYAYSTGTSMATAMVSGIAAMSFSALGGNVPDYMDTPAWMHSLLNIGATDLLEAGWDTVSGNGAVCASTTAYMATWRPLASATVQAIPEQEYTGQPLTPKPVITYMGTTLEEGVHYQLEYSNNTQAGKATVLARGLGVFFGEIATTFNIVDLKEIPLPKAKEGLEYNGEEQEGVAAGEGYTLSGTASATRVGSYVVTAVLEKGYVWENGSKADYVIEWALAPKKIPVPKAQEDLLYTGQEIQGVAAGQGYVLSGTTQAVEVGEYVAVAEPEAPNYEWEDGSTSAVEIAWNIQPQRYVERPTAIEGLVYNGKLQQGVTADQEYDGKAFRLEGAFQATNAGSYQAQATLNPGYLWSDGGAEAVSVSWEISPLSVEVPQGGSFEYTGEDQAVFDGLASSSGALYTWGNNGSGQLGDATTTDRNKPVKVLDNVACASMGRYHSAAVTQDGSLYTWGLNTSGQLGTGSFADSTVPVKVLDNVASVALGHLHSAAVLQDGSLYMWGDNDHGQLGTGTYQNASKPVEILDGVVSVSLGKHHSAAVTQDGSLYMWGGNDYGQLGDGTTVNKSTPVKVLDGVASVSLGHTHSAAVTQDGALYAWGGNDYGQLGDGTTVDGLAPVKILDGVASASMGLYHSAAVTQDGSLYMWGSNEYGQLGDATYKSKTAPVKVMDGIASASVGRYHSAAVAQDGSLYTWGASGSGLLGDGTVSYRCKPVKVLDGVAFASLGSDHSSCVVASAWTNGSYVVSGSAKESQVGTYTALVSPGANYVWPDGGTDSKEITWSIEPKAVCLEDMVGKDMVYTGTRQVGVQSGDGYSLSGTITAVNAGQYSAHAELWDSNYIWSDGTTEPREISWSVEPAVLTAAYAGEHISPGSQPALRVDVTGFVQGEDASTALDYVAPYVEAPDSLKVGDSYELTPQDGQASNYVFQYQSGMLVVGHSPLADADVSLSFKSAVYNGKVQKPGVTVAYEGSQLTESVDYQVAYGSGCKRSGTYSVTVTGMGEYQGQQNLTFKIIDAKLTASNVSMSATSFVYNGQVRKPTATVRVNGISQLKGEYSVTYWNKAKSKQVAVKQVGTYFAKIQAKDNANTTGTVWKQLTVKPQATANLKLTALDNGFKASWAKRAVQVSGYQVSYRQVGAASWKTKNVSGCNVTTGSVKALKDKKSYQVRVRTYKTVGGVKYFSAWTSTKTVRTK